MVQRYFRAVAVPLEEALSKCLYNPVGEALYHSISFLRVRAIVWGHLAAIAVGYVVISYRCI